MYKFVFATSETDPYKIHQQVKGLFPENRYLYRLDGDTITAQGSTLPQNSVRGKISTLKTRYEAGAELCFRIRANPTNKIDKGVVPLKTSFEASDWFHRMGNLAGYKPVTLSVIMEGIVFVTKDGVSWPINSVSYEGLLRVTDAGKFEGAIMKGIGREKSFGFGMLDIYE